MESRSTIPLPIKRQIRQESGFGCCKCGLPIIQYHHIEPYTKEDPNFRPEDMMCLCPTHHHEATVGAMTNKEQRKLKNKPLNIRNNKAEGLLKINQKSLVLGIGDTQLISDDELITIDNENIIRLKRKESGAIDLTIKLFDSNNNLLLYIENSEWVSGEYLPWDIESSFQWLILRHDKRSIALKIDARKSPISIIGNIFYNGYEINLRKNGIFFKDLKYSIMNLCFVGSIIKIDTRSKQFSIAPHPAYNNHTIISEPNIDKRIEMGLKAFEKMKLNNA